MQRNRRAINADTSAQLHPFKDHSQQDNLNAMTGILIAVAIPEKPPPWKPILYFYCSHLNDSLFLFQVN